MKAVTVAGLAAIVAVTISATAASGGVRVKSELDSYCSPTGDYCLGIEYQHKRVKLQIVSPALTGPYTLCVRGPQARKCLGFRFHDAGDANADSIDWERRFGSQGSGTYLVKWKIDGSTIGKTLGFRI